MAATQVQTESPAERDVDFDITALEPRLQADILKHAEEMAPNECCGVIVARPSNHQRAVRGRNIAAHPEKDFHLHPNDFRKAEVEHGKVVASYHSHINKPPNPSDGDKTDAELKHLPMVVVSWPSKTWAYYHPCGWRAPLLGRPFVHGVLDCYTFIQDYYRQELSIELPNFDREDGWWWKGQDLYLDNFRKNGFVGVSDLKKHDILLMQVPPSPKVNHSAVYIGDGQIMHHLFDRISCVHNYTGEGAWSRMVHMIIRHESLYDH